MGTIDSRSDNQPQTKLKLGPTPGRDGSGAPPILKGPVVDRNRHLFFFFPRVAAAPFDLICLLQSGEGARDHFWGTLALTRTLTSEALNSSRRENQCRGSSSVRGAHRFLPGKESNVRCSCELCSFVCLTPAVVAFLEDGQTVIWISACDNCIGF